MNPLEGMKRVRSQDEFPVFDDAYWQGVQQKIREQAQVVNKDKKLQDNILHKVLRMHTNARIMQHIESVPGSMATVPIQVPADICRPAKTGSCLALAPQGPHANKEFESQGNAFKKYPNDVLFDAIKRGDKEAIQTLLSRDSIPPRIKNAAGCTVLHVAACHNAEILQFLVESYFLDDLVDEPNNANFTPLFYAVSKGALDSTKYLLLHGADKDRLAGSNFDISLIDYAARYARYDAKHGGHIEILALLIDEYNMPFDKPNNYNRTPLHQIAAGGHLNGVKYLLEKGANKHACDEDGSTLIHYAAVGGNVDMMRFLCDDCGMRDLIDKPDKNGMTPLLNIVEEGNNNTIPMIDFLLAQGADIYACDVQGQGVLHHAAYNENGIAIMQFLLDQLKDTKEKLIERYVAAKEYDKLFTLLVKKNMSINEKEKKRRKTPLHIAAKIGNLPMVKFLVSQGADIRAEASFKRKKRPFHTVGSPFKLAKNKEQYHIVDFIVNYSAEQAEYRCPICFSEPVEPNQHTVAHLNCLHFLCKTCKSTLLAQDDWHCPTCRGPLGKDYDVGAAPSHNDEERS